MPFKMPFKVYRGAQQLKNISYCCDGTAGPKGHKDGRMCKDVQGVIGKARQGLRYCKVTGDLGTWLCFALLLLLLLLFLLLLPLSHPGKSPGWSQSASAVTSIKTCVPAATGLAISRGVMQLKLHQSKAISRHYSVQPELHVAAATCAPCQLY